MAFNENELHYSAESSAVHYSYHPVGTLSIPRLAASKEYFKNTHAGLAKKKKTLVLADWSIAQWNDKKTQSLCTYLSQLQTSGNRILVWQNGKLVPFTGTLTKEMKNLITPVTAEELKKVAAKQHKITANQLFIVDDYDYQNDIHKGSKIRLCPISKIRQAKHNVGDLIKILAAWNPSITVRLEKFPDDIRYLHSIEEHIGQLPLPQVCITEAEFNSQMLAQIYDQEQIINHNIIFNNFANIKKLEVYAKQSIVENLEFTTHFNHLLTKIESLITLNFANFSNNLQTLTLSSSLPQLETLGIRGCELTSQSLCSILYNTPKLKNLRLMECWGITEDFNLTASLDFLKNLTFYGNRNQHILSSILQKSPSLELLELFHAQQINEAFNFEGSLNALVEINIFKNDLCNQSLINLLNKSCNLIRLSLSYCRNITAEIIDFLPSSITDLNISLTDIIPESVFLDLLAKLPNLINLNIEHYESLSLEIINNFPVSLESLNVPKQALSIEQVTLLFEKLPNLRSLVLKDCPDINCLFAFENNFDQISQLTLSDKNSLSEEKLIQLLAKFPNLKKLDLIRCKEFKQYEISERLFRALSTIEVQYPLPYCVVNGPRTLRHNPKTHLKKPQRVPFKFSGTNKSKCQNMIIEKFSQYLILNNKFGDWVARLQGGMCNTLAYYCAAKTADEWKVFLDTLVEWDGQAATLDANPLLKSLLEDLTAYIYKYQLNSEHHSGTFVGDAIDEILKNQPIGSSLVVTNPWHAVYLRKTAKDEWFFYDPNDPSGGATFSEDEMPHTLKISQGRLLNISTLNMPIKIVITDPIKFIENGGLLILCEATNNTDILKVLQTVDLKMLPQAAFDGLFLRDNATKPAFRKGFESRNLDIRNFFQQAFNAYKIQFPEAFAKKMSELSGETYPPLPIYSKPKNQPAITSAVQPIILPPALKSRKKYRIPEGIIPIAHQPAEAPPEALGYLQDLVKPGPLKRKLIELISAEEVQGLYCGLQKYCTNISRPLFYVNSPDDLICSAPRPVRIGDSLQGDLKDRGGPLYDMLQQQYTPDNPLIIMVDYSKFKAKDVVRYNALLEGVVDGVPLPASTIVIGVLNTKEPGCYRLADFYSRFKILEPGMQKQDLEKAITSCPLSAEVLNSYIPELPFSTPSPDDNDVFTINLFNADNWKERLLGQWILQGDDLFFEKGALYEAIASGKPILIENGLWEDQEFVHFWQQAMLTGVIPESDIPFQPIKQHYLRKEGYDWNQLWQKVRLDNSYHPEALTLNPGLCAQLFQRYICKDSLLFTQPGDLQKYANQDLHLNLTHDLSPDLWAECLTQARFWNVSLHVHYAPCFGLPSVHPKTDAAPAMGYLANPWSKDIQNKVQILSSSDPDTTIKLLTKNKDDCEVWNISECDAAQLLGSLKGERTADKKFIFTALPSALHQALDEGKTIILTGHFSDDLIDNLAPLLLDNSLTKGRLVLVHEQPNEFAFTKQEEHYVTFDLQRQCLNPVSDEEWSAIRSDQLEPLSVLKSRLDYLRAHPGLSVEDAWIGMRCLPAMKPLEDLNHANSEQDARDFTAARLSAVEAVLHRSPFAYLTGLTSVGKTTFVRRSLKTEKNYYEGYTQIAQWVRNKDTSRKILFLDEANLGQQQWSMMEGLFNKPPGIFFEGVYYPLDEYHKVVFAGNPLNYGEHSDGDERHLAPFFARHGHAVLFDPLPLANIYQEVLKPVLTAPIDTSGWGLPSIEEQEVSLFTPEICEPILKVYKFLCALSKEDVLITPRELQMMAMLVRSYSAHNGKDPIAAAQYYAYHLSHHLVPDDHKAAFMALFGEIPQLERRCEEPLIPVDFHITDERKPLCDLFIDLLELRKARQCSTSPEFRYGGLGGLILEGEPGIGKSDLAVHLLVSQGFSEQKFDCTRPLATESQKFFYRMPVSWSLEAKIALLMHAFNEGSVVLIDEINSSPMMEQLLNSLLMGTDLEGNSPKIPGFMVVGTQNPVSMEGRIAPSSALFHRFITMVLKPYTDKEMEDILSNFGLEGDLAYALIELYKQVRESAFKLKLPSIPCFRDLVQAAKYLLNGQIATIEPEPTIVHDPALDAPIVLDKDDSYNYNFLLKAAAAICATVGIVALAITCLAIAAIISISNVGLISAFAVTVVGGLLAYGLFKISKEFESPVNELVDKENPAASSQATSF